MTDMTKVGDTQVPSKSDDETPVELTFGAPTPEESRNLRKAGGVTALADLVWIFQAGLIAFALASLLDHSLLPDAGAADKPPLQSIFLASGGVVLLAGLRAFISYLGQARADRTAQMITSRIRAELVQRAAQSDPGAVFPSSGRFSAHVSEQVDFLGPYFRNFFPQTVRVKIVPLMIVVVTAMISWAAALILLVTGPVIPVFMALIGTRAKAASAGQQEDLTRLSGTLMDRIRGLETLSLFGAVRRSEHDIAKSGEAFRIGTMKVLAIAFLSSTVLELFSALGIAFVAVYVGFSLLGDIQAGTWGAPLSYWQGLFVLLLAPEFFAPLRGYAAAYHDRAAGLAAQEKLSEFAEQIAQPNPAKRISAPSCLPADLSKAPEVRFLDLELGYSGKSVLSGLSIVVPCGQTLVVQGPSGSGKTSLIDCVLGFRQPRAGVVTINGSVLDQAFAKSLRSRVMWLGQEPKLFRGSLRSNLLKGVGEPEAVKDDQIWSALELAGAADLVKALPRGWQTTLGEDGFGLSVGEMRRIALARAALRTDAVLLLADEPTAGLDQQTVADVISGLEVLAKGRTALIATHDPSVLRLGGQNLDLAELSSGTAPELVS